MVLLSNRFASIALKLFGNIPMIITDFEETAAKWSLELGTSQGQVGQWDSCLEC